MSAESVGSITHSKTQNKNHNNQTIDFFVKQNITAPSNQIPKSSVKQSVRYSPAAATINMRNQTSSPKAKNILDINSVSLNISELYKQYSKKQTSNMLNNT